MKSTRAYETLQYAVHLEFGRAYSQCLDYSSYLKKEAVNFSKTSLNCRTARRFIFMFTPVRTSNPTRYEDACVFM